MHQMIMSRADGMNKVIKQASMPEGYAICVHFLSTTLMFNICLIAYILQQTHTVVFIDIMIHIREIPP